MSQKEANRRKKGRAFQQISLHRPVFYVNTHSEVEGLRTETFHLIGPIHRRFLSTEMPHLKRLVMLGHATEIFRCFAAAKLHPRKSGLTLQQAESINKRYS